MFNIPYILNSKNQPLDHIYAYVPKIIIYLVIFQVDLAKNRIFLFSFIDKITDLLTYLWFIFEKKYFEDWNTILDLSAHIST
jgi:hypothetical protein